MVWLTLGLVFKAEAQSNSQEKPMEKRKPVCRSLSLLMQTEGANKSNSKYAEV